MCLGGGSKAPPKPEPAPPPPPPVTQNTQVAPAPAENEATTNQSESGTVAADKQGTKKLKIPLITNTGAGINLPT